VKSLDASMPVYQMKTLESQLDETLLTDRLIATLSAGFGLLATVLASIGLYGVMAFVVARRRKELGIRLALGADTLLACDKEVPAPSPAVCASRGRGATCRELAGIQPTRGWRSAL
jgi:hypothetical protein